MHTPQPYRPRVSDSSMAALLGITEAEFASLHHSGVRNLTDSYGVVYKHYIQFSPHNNTELLERMQLCRSHTVYFTPEQLQQWG